jgi:hypothetical protein
MKKRISKLTLKQETLRTLTRRGLEKAGGGFVEDDSSCTAKTRMVSGCASDLDGTSPGA